MANDRVRLQDGGAKETQPNPLSSLFSTLFGAKLRKVGPLRHYRRNLFLLLMALGLQCEAISSRSRPSQPLFSKLNSCPSAKYMWNSLQTAYLSHPASG